MIRKLYAMKKRILLLQKKHYSEERCNFNRFLAILSIKIANDDLTNPQHARPHWFVEEIESMGRGANNGSGRKDVAET